MRITYDSRVDAAYFYLAEKKEPPETLEFDSDIFLDFDLEKRLMGLEVLDASKRLDLDQLLPFVEIITAEDQGWHQLKATLLRYKQKGIPVKSHKQGSKNQVEKIADDYITLKPETSVNVIRISRSDLEVKDKSWHKTNRRLAIVEALWELGEYD